MHPEVRWTMYFVLHYLLYYQNIHNDKNLSRLQIDLLRDCPLGNEHRANLGSKVYTTLVNVCGDGKQINPGKIKLLYDSLTYQDESEVRQLKFAYKLLGQKTFIDDLINELELF